MNMTVYGYDYSCPGGQWGPPAAELLRSTAVCRGHWYVSHTILTCFILKSYIMLNTMQLVVNPD